MKLARLLVHAHQRAHPLDVRRRARRRVSGTHSAPPMRPITACSVEVAVLLVDARAAGGSGRRRVMTAHGMQVCTQAISSGSSARYGDAVGARPVDAAWTLLTGSMTRGRGRGVAERGAQHVAERVARAPQRLGAVRRLLEDAGHHRRVQHLHDDGGRCRRRRRSPRSPLISHEMLPGPPPIPGSPGCAVVDRGLVVAAAGRFELRHEVLPEAFEPLARGAGDPIRHRSCLRSVPRE